MSTKMDNEYEFKINKDNKIVTLKKYNVLKIFYGNREVSVVSVDKVIDFSDVKDAQKIAFHLHNILLILFPNDKEIFN